MRSAIHVLLPEDIHEGEGDALVHPDARHTGPWPLQDARSDACEPTSTSDPDTLWLYDDDLSPIQRLAAALGLTPSAA